jgi:hypothetical protein
LKDCRIHLHELAGDQHSILNHLADLRLAKVLVLRLLWLFRDKIIRYLSLLPGSQILLYFVWTYRRIHYFLTYLIICSLGHLSTAVSDSYIVSIVHYLRTFGIITISLRNGHQLRLWTSFLNETVVLVENNWNFTFLRNLAIVSANAIICN